MNVLIQYQFDRIHSALLVRRRVYQSFHASVQTRTNLLFQWQQEMIESALDWKIDWHKKIFSLLVIIRQPVMTNVKFTGHKMYVLFYP